MIIKTKVRGGPTQLADYLLRNEKNERAELLEMRGFRGTLKGALSLEEELTRRETHCEKPFYHVAFRAAPGEELNEEQWRKCADRLEEKLGLEGHNRAMVLHEKEGERHLHVVWSRLDPETLKAANLYHDHYRCKEVAREIERELNLTRVRDKAPERELDAPTMGEEQQARRKGQELDKTREAIREAWEKSKDGRSFAEELEKRGLALAQGDRRDFVALDQEGSVYTIGKRTTGARAAEVREKLADLDRERVPTVEKAREKAQALEREREERAEREREKTPERTAEKERKIERNPQKIERFLKRQDEIKAELLKRQEAAREAMKERMQQRDAKLEAWFRVKGKRLEEQLEEKIAAQRLTRRGGQTEEARRQLEAKWQLEEKWQRGRLERQKESLTPSLEKIRAIRAVENASRLELQEVRQAEQRARLEIRQAEIRERYGIPAPERDEAARRLTAETRQTSFSKAERETDGMSLKAKADKIKRDAEERRQERVAQRKREAAERKQERERRQEERAEKRKLWEEERKQREERAEQRKRDYEERQQEREKTRERERVERDKQRRWETEERKQERTQQRENELAAQAPPVPDLVSGKKAGRALGTVVDAPLKALEGVLDFFVGGTPPKKPERPIKTMEEREAERKASLRAELERLRSMSAEERKQERERQREERERRNRGDRER